MTVLIKLAQYRKAIAAVLAPLVAFLGAESVSVDGFWQVLIVVVSTGLAVWRTPNAPKQDPPATPYGFR